MNYVGQCFRWCVVVGCSVCLLCINAFAGDTLTSLYGWQLGSSWAVTVKSRVMDIEAPSARGSNEDRFQELQVTYTYKGLAVEGGNSFAEFNVQVLRGTALSHMRVLYNDEEGGYPTKVFNVDGDEMDSVPRDVPLFIPLKNSKVEEVISKEDVRVKRISEEQVMVEDYVLWQSSPSEKNPPAHAKAFGARGMEQAYVLKEKLDIDWPNGVTWWKGYKRFHGYMVLPVLEASLKQ